MIDCRKNSIRIKSTMMTMDAIRSTRPTCSSIIKSRDCADAFDAKITSAKNAISLFDAKSNHHKGYGWLA